VHRYKTALILGTGRSGRAAEALLRSEGVTSFSISQECTPDYRYDQLHFDPDVAVVSPGFALTHPWITDLNERGIPLLSELDLGWSRRHCPVIAVTGSNGKSTLVKLLAEMLALDGKRAVPCGNYGLPVSAAVLLPQVPDWLVIEVSSFQLETIREFRPDIGVLLNVLPNHLDRHGTMEAYARIKYRLFEKMQSTDRVIVPCEQTPIPGNNGPGFRRTFGLKEQADFRFANGFAAGADLRGTGFDNELRGAAAAAAAAVCEACGTPLSALEKAARDFKPLPHRMQTVAQIGGVTYIDDSKATNQAALSAALRICSGPVHLIAGGRSKETDFGFMKDLLARRGVRLYLIGEASSAMVAAWSDTVECICCETLDRAVEAAGKRAVPGETVLLSPACTSFDQFDSFGERGERFAAAVQRQHGKRMTK
jgi:UDP-N-acetylmuramoylalanine--D-glutamate ligase